MTWIARALKKQMLQSHISSLIDKKQNRLHKSEEIVQEFRSYYESLYNLHPDPQNPNEIAKRLAKISVFLEQHSTSFNLSQTDMEDLEAPITEDEFRIAVKSLKPGKAPGPDGLTAQYYKAFNTILAPAFVSAFNNITNSSVPSPQFLEAHITVIPKPEKDKQYCTNYRPISLLNLDAKLLAKILANRLLPLIPDHICPDQAGFIPGREAKDNVMRTINLMAHVIKNDIKACILSTDAEKAFDRVEWDYIHATLVKLGLGASMRRPALKEFAAMLAFVFAIKEVNLDAKLLPNITLGYDGYDSCKDNMKALRATMYILSGGKEDAPNYSCQKRGEVAGFVGDNVAMAQLLATYGHTKISYGVRDPFPQKNDDLFSSFFTMSQYDKVFYVAVALLLKHFGWFWIGVLSPPGDSEDIRLRTLSKELTRHGVCISVLVKLSEKSLEILQLIEKSTAKVYVICGDLSAMYLYLRLAFNFVYDKTLIVNDSWIMHYHLGLPFYRVINCSLSLSPLERNVSTLWNAIYNAHRSMSRDMILSTIWEIHCPERSHMPIDTHASYLISMNCTENNNPLHTIYRGDVTPYYVMTAVFVLANALHDMRTTMACTTRGPALCDYREKLKHFVRRLRYTDSIGEDIFFESSRQLRSRPELSLKNWVMNGTFNKYAVINAGHIYVNESLPEEEWLTVKEHRIVWRTGRVPQSRCCERCVPGYRKVSNGGRHICCYDCAPCSEGEISNQTDSETCWKCPDDQQPNDQKTHCVPKLYEFLSYKEDFLSTLFSLVAVMCSAITSCIIKLFRAHWDSPVVKANNRTVSFILLTSILLSFLCVFLFLAHPVDITCMLRQVLYGICFSIALSSVLAKTIQVCIAFKATKPGTIWRKWVGSQVSNSVVVSCSCVQVLICVTWLSVSPPYQEYDMLSSSGRIVIQCNEGSVVFFYCVLGYMGFQAGVSLVLAFMVRTLPDSFNEAKYITFSMLVFCSVWIAMIPAYLSTRGKYTVAVQIFAILTSNSGLLGCIFLPKCYHILLNTQVYTRKPIVVK
ncbi:vomeronasal type-2 receptor 26-like [Hyperolius riggenbachi]|uniref:vomeronasal type-2 receptor 26-like n=1 Tax=Hyperolius riggenbachi TaxID=752182 RepID=UPI0035A262B2